MSLTPQANGSAATCDGAQDVARLAASSQVKAAFAWFTAHAEQLNTEQMDVTRIPAPPFGEMLRARWLQERFRQLGLEDVHESGGNVFAVRPGTASGQKYIALTAHLDTVFPAGTALNVHRDGERLFGPGIADNGAGLTALLALAAAMNAAQVQTAAPILFIGNVGEEGEGDLRGMREIYSDPRWKNSIGCTVVVDGAGSETVVSAALGSRRFQVTVRGPGGHSWSDFGAPNPIVVLARAIETFSRTPVPTEPKTSFNVGVISGGTSVNSIPESATMKVDIRSASTAEIERLEKALRQALDEAVRAGRSDAKTEASALTAEVKLIGSRPGAELSPDAPILHVLRAVDAHLGINTRVQRASTDANIPLALGMQAIALGAGGAGGGAHTVHEWYDPTGRELGLQRILLTVLALAGVQE
jgi:acetylornithine deacetylase/succinyl-diaminopimelate desuccinylase-like protein